MPNVLFLAGSRLATALGQVLYLLGVGNTKDECLPVKGLWSVSTKKHNFLDQKSLNLTELYAQVLRKPKGSVLMLKAVEIS